MGHSGPVRAPEAPQRSQHASSWAKRAPALPRNFCARTLPARGLQLPPTELPGHLGGVTAVEYQHEDKFLAVARWVLTWTAFCSRSVRRRWRRHQAVAWKSAWELHQPARVLPAAAWPLAVSADDSTLPHHPSLVPRSGGGSVTLYSEPHRTGPAGAVPLHPAADTSARLCLSVAAAGEPSVAAGSAAGGVTVWDVPTQRVREHYAEQHSGGVAALGFVPLRPGMLYSAGADGRVCLQVRMLGAPC